MTKDDFNTFRMYHVYIILFGLLLGGIIMKCQDDFWGNQKKIFNKKQFDINVSSLKYQGGALSFNDSIKADMSDFNLLEMSNEKLDWYKIETPFRLIRIMESDTVFLINKYNDTLVLKFNPISK